MKRSESIAAISILGLVTVSGWQNCSGGFQSISAKQASIQPPSQASIELLDDGYDVILVAGQSNAVGALIGPFPAEDQSHDELIFQVNRDRPQPLIVPVVNGTVHHWYISDTRRAVSFGMSFAREYAKKLKPGRRVLLVPTAKGSTSILEWNQKLYVAGGDDAYVKKDFETIRPDMGVALNFALSLPNARLVTVLWHQGETDIMLAARAWGPDSAYNAMYAAMPNAQRYTDELRELIEYIYGNAKGQRDFKIIAGAPVATWAESDSAVRTAKREFAERLREMDRNRDDFIYVDSEGLNSYKDSNPDLVDEIHFDAASQILYGKRMFSAWHVAHEAETRITK